MASAAATSFKSPFLKARQVTPENWSDFYLDYPRVLKLLSTGGSACAKHASNNIQSSIGGIQISVRTTISSLPPQHVSRIFIDELDDEIDKVALFVTKQQGDIADRLLRAMSRSSNDERGNTGDFGPTVLYGAGLDLLHLIHYVRTNILAIDKLLTVHDRIIGLPLGMKIEHYFLAGAIGRERTLRDLNFRNGNDAIGQGRLDMVHRHGGIGPLVGLAKTVYHKWEKQQKESSIELERSHYNFGKEPSDGIRLEVAEWEEQDVAFNSMSRAASLVSMLPLSSTHEYGSMTDMDETSTKFSAEDARTATPDLFLRIDIALNELSRCSSFVERWAAVSGIEDGKSRGRAKAKDAMSSRLNLINSFLYMVSYYMVAPSSGAYASRLGLDPSLSGAIIGITAFAALASTFLYSWWTSYSYKDALVFSSICCLLGNVMYALGLPFDSLSLVFVGRLLNGFGSARAINRRFIADAFSNADRTAASAAFVASSAAGMSFGPALSALISFFVSEDNLYWQEENAPAWIVAVLWLIFLVMHVLYFADPPKQKVLEFGGDKCVMQPLVFDKNGKSTNASAEKKLWERPACLVTIYLVFLLKLVLELVLSSAAPICSYNFGWSASATGCYLAVGNGLVLPASLAVTYLSRYFQDRQLILLASSGMTLGGLVVTWYAPTEYKYSLRQYIAGTCLLFIAPNIMEAPSMSLLSKNIPVRLRSGLFNLGFFTTEAGFGGRVVADSFLTIVGSWGIDGLVNNLYFPLVVVSSLSLALVYATYDELVEPDERDD